MATERLTAATVAVVDKTPIALRAPAKRMMTGVAVSKPSCASLMTFPKLETG
jgi:hypothetical protein